MLFPRTRKAAWLPLSRRAASGSARQIFVRRARRESLEAIAALLILWPIRSALASSLPAMHPLPRFHQHLPFTLARDQFDPAIHVPCRFIAASFRRLD